MICDSLLELYRRMRLLNYKTVFDGVKEKNGSLSATEAFSADIVYILGEPTISEFADMIGISQPNATYKINSLVSKGYIDRVTNPNDRRETHLRVSRKFLDYLGNYSGAIVKNAADAEKKFSKEELETASRVLDEILKGIEEIKTE